MHREVGSLKVQVVEGAVTRDAPIHSNFAPGQPGMAKSTQSIVLYVRKPTCKLCRLKRDCSLVTAISSPYWVTGDAGIVVSEPSREIDRDLPR